MTTRRAFLTGIGLALATPALVRSESLMKLWVPKPAVLMPTTGRLLNGGTGATVGWWIANERGRINFRWDDVENDHWQSGTNHDAETFNAVLRVLDAVAA